MRGTRLTTDPGALTGTLARDAEAGFDLERGPLVRASLHVLADAGAVLVLTASAPCADPQSFFPLLDEMAERYQDVAPATIRSSRRLRRVAPRS